MAASDFEAETQEARNASRASARRSESSAFRSKSSLNHSLRAMSLQEENSVEKAVD
jgi:hypothetical protein